MKISIEEIKKLQVLSALQSTDEELNKLAEDFEQITAFVEEVCSAKIDEVLDFCDAVRVSSLREDEIVESMSIDEVLKNAPEKEKTSFLVPKVVD